MCVWALRALRYKSIMNMTARPLLFAQLIRNDGDELDFGLVAGAWPSHAHILIEGPNPI